MSPRLRSLITCGLLAIATLLFYGIRLAGPLAPAERALADQARAIAATGHDLEGHTFPLYLHVADAEWLQPVPVYVSALLLRGLPADEDANRWPGLLAGALDVALLFLIVRRLVGRDLPAAIAAGLLILTPAHFSFSRVALDSIFQLPFVLGWLLCLFGFLELGGAWRLFAAMFLLGIGCFTATSAPITMGAYAVLTMFALRRHGSAVARHYAVAAAGFVLPLLLTLPWYAAHPATYADTLGRWAIHPAHLRYPLEGLRALVNWGALGGRASIYWALLNPAFLFLPGGSPLPGFAPGPWILLTPLAGLMLAGGSQMISEGLSPTSLVLVCGYLLAPMSASTFGEPDAIGRALALVPCAVLIAARGATWLISAPVPILRAAGIALLLLVPVQFAFFHHESLAAPPAAITKQGPNIATEVTPSPP